LTPASSGVFKEMNDNNLGDLEKTERALSELSLNKGIRTFEAPLIQGSDCNTLKQEYSLHLARRKSLQHAPVVSSPLARKVWSQIDT